MSDVVPVSYLVNSAAIAIGDPRKTRVIESEWLDIYNASQRELCTKANILQFRGTFTLTTSAIYGWPKEMTVMTMLEVNDDPTTNPYSWRPLDEKFEDEWRAEISGGYPSGTLPQRYFAQAGWFFVTPRPEASIVAGGRITYYGKPDRVFDLDTALLQVPDFCEDWVLRRMIIHGLKARNRHDEAVTELRLWEASIETLVDKMDDRSLDRRSTIAPRKNRYAGMN